MMKAIAQVNSEPCRPRRQVLCRFAATAAARWENGWAGLRAWTSAMIASLCVLLTLHDRIFREGLPDAGERLLGGRLRRHSVADHFGGRGAPDLLGVALGVAGVESGVISDRRIDHAFLGVS